MKDNDLTASCQPECRSARDMGYFPFHADHCPNWTRPRAVTRTHAEVAATPDPSQDAEGIVVQVMPVQRTSWHCPVCDVVLDQDGGDHWCAVRTERMPWRAASRIRFWIAPMKKAEP